MTRSDPAPGKESLADRVGPKTATRLAELGLHTVDDLLWHLPRRYYSTGEVTRLAELRVGETVTVVATVVSATTRRMRSRRGTITTVTVTDGERILDVTFFSQPWRDKQLPAGRRVILSGTVASYRGRLQLSHPLIEPLDEESSTMAAAPDSAPESRAVAHASRLVSVYPATTSMPSWLVAKAVAVVLPDVDHLPDPVSAQAAARHALLSRPAAFRAVHTPADREQVEQGRRRLAYEEALVLQVELLRRRALAQSSRAHPRPLRSGGLLEAFDDALEWTLTDGQTQVGEQITADLAGDIPMLRLLQGDVGAGKTLVALRAMLTVVDNGGQAVLLAPTEVLASQHARALRELLGPLAEAGLLGGSDRGTRVCLLTGSMTTKQRRQRLADVAAGQAGIVVGTHALLYGGVQFADLGLVVIDEQHRFGVEQRAALAGQQPDGTRPHVLVMTATPIPRTVAMTVFGDLDVSILADLPPGRGEVTTHVVPVVDKPHYLPRVWERIREEVALGRRAYVVCPRIGSLGDADVGPGDEAPAEDEIDAKGESEQQSASADHHGPPAAVGSGTARPLTSVLELYTELAHGPLSDLRLAPLHGGLTADVKDHTMRRFGQGELDVLVSTTVVEVGVDVAEASVMVVCDAERFGVSQLHQLRGRVGRGAIPGVCLLVTRLEDGSPARERLEAVAATRDGFELARIDLQQRREGDVLGALQSGKNSSLRVLSVLRDERVIADARVDAATILEADPSLTSHEPLAAAVAALAGTEAAEYMEKA